MPIVGDGQLNLAALVTDDIYVVIVPPQTPLIPGVPTNGIGIVGTASRGKPNQPILTGDPTSLVRNFGNIAVSPFDLVTEAIGAMKQGANTVYCVRVTDGTDLVATTQIIDDESAAKNLVAVKGTSSGIWGNGIIVTAGVGSNNKAVFASGVYTLSGTWTSGIATAVINGNSVSSAVGTTVDNAYTIAASLAAAMLASTLIMTVIGSVTLGGNATSATITITARTAGTTGNAITTTASTTGGTCTVGGTKLAGGTSVQTYKVSIRTPNDLPEVFDNIPGVAGVAFTGTVDANGQPNGAVVATDSVAANIVRVVNNGVTNIRGPSALVVASIATANVGTGVPINQSQTLAGGTDGRSGVNTGILIGNDGVTSGGGSPIRTGMYALRGLPIAQFGIAGLTDPTAWSLEVGFAQSENVTAVLGVASFTDSQTAVTNKLANGIDAYQAVMVKDWLYLNDTQNSQIRIVSPIGACLGIMGNLSPERSPANKPIQGYLGTERTGYVGPGGAFVPGIAYSSAEIGLLTSGGITFFLQPSVGGSYMSLRNGQNTSSDPTRNGINYSKLTPFIAKSLANALGFAVEEVHTPQLRRRVASAISQFLASLATPGPGRSPMIGDVSGGPAFSVICDNTNNPANLVALGYMFASVQVKYFSIVRFFVVQVEAGQSVTVQVQQSPTSQLAAA